MTMFKLIFMIFIKYNILYIFFSEESKTDLNYSNTCVPPSLSLLFIGHEFLGK